MTMTDPAIRLRGIRKTYDRTEVLHGVDLHVAPASATGLVGENGAGKSTLLGILSGTVRPDEGIVEIAGERVSHFDPRVMLRRHRVALVPQELDLCLDRTVAGNVFLGLEGSSVVRSRSLNQRARTVLDRLGLNIDPRRVARSLPPSEQQMVVIARALARECRIILLDEPTAILTPSEAEVLHSVIAQLTAQGRTVVYVSHHLADVVSQCDHIVVMRNGSVAGRHAAGVGQEELVTEMVGALGDRRTQGTARQPARTAGDGLRLESWRVPGIDPVDLRVGAGEIVGIAGLPDSGRQALLDSLIDGRKSSGRAYLHDAVLKAGSPRTAITNRVAYLPAERRSAGAFMNLSVADNLVASHSRGLERLIQSSRSRRRQAAGAHLRAAVAGSLRQPMRTLSGGNQQKVILTRCIDRRPRLLLLSEPTRGIDIEAKRTIHERIRGVASQGIPVLVTSADVLELLALCDRIVVMRRGRIVADLTRADADEETITAFSVSDQTASPVTSLPTAARSAACDAPGPRGPRVVTTERNHP